MHMANTLQEFIDLRGSLLLTSLYSMIDDWKMRKSAGGDSQLCDENAKVYQGLKDELEKIMECPIPGNTRELALEEAILCCGNITEKMVQALELDLPKIKVLVTRTSEDRAVCEVPAYSLGHATDLLSNNPEDWVDAGWNLVSTDYDYQASPE